MSRAALLFFVAATLNAQNPLVTRGADLFRTTCAVAYCHGPNGTPGKAPQLAGRTFASRTLSEVIRFGKPSSGMPAFGRQLKPEDIEALTQYILSLSDPAHEGPAPAAQAKLAPAAEKGRALFFDAVRFGGCGRCHELNDRGVNIGPNLKGSFVSNLRAGSATRLKLAAPAGEDPFPAVVVEETADRVRVYDLSSKLPVLRTFPPAQVKLTSGAAWSHAEVTRDYSDAELQSIADYLKVISRD